VRREIRVMSENVENKDLKENRVHKANVESKDFKESKVHRESVESKEKRVIEVSLDLWALWDQEDRKVNEVSVVYKENKEQ
jgi:hypothetical protein